MPWGWGSSLSGNLLRQGYQKPSDRPGFEYFQKLIPRFQYFHCIWPWVYLRASISSFATRLKFLFNRPKSQDSSRQNQADTAASVFNLWDLLFLLAIGPLLVTGAAAKNAQNPGKSAGYIRSACISWTVLIGDIEIKRETARTPKARGKGHQPLLGEPSGPSPPGAVGGDAFGRWGQTANWWSCTRSIQCLIFAQSSSALYIPSQYVQPPTRVSSHLDKCLV